MIGIAYLKFDVIIFFRIVCAAEFRAASFSNIHTDFAVQSHCLWLDQGSVSFALSNEKFNLGHVLENFDRVSTLDTRRI